MKPKNILLSTRQTAYEYFKQQHDDLSAILPREELEKIIASHNTHYESLSHVRKVLENAGLPYQRVYQPYAAFEEFKGRDLVISLGGDGTVLNTAHYIRDATPVLTVRSEPNSYGGLCTIDAKNFRAALERLLQDNFEIEDWTRLEGRFGNRHDLALNDILLGPKYSPGAARYEICLGEEKEKQVSSGVIVSTGAGSTGWYVNIPGNEGMFPKTSQELRFIAREYRTNAGYRLTRGKLLPGQFLEIKSLMNIDGIISFDGDTQKRMHDFSRGQTVKIGISDKPLSTIVFRKPF